MQGRGVGAKMMKDVADHADAENMKCYLETSRDVPNTAIYGRWGVEFLKETICDDDGDAIKLLQWSGSLMPNLATAERLAYLCYTCIRFTNVVPRKAYMRPIRRGSRCDSCAFME